MNLIFTLSKFLRIYYALLFAALQDILIFFQDKSHWAILHATCVATKLIEKLQEKLPGETY